jgi:hypothetical protein
MARNPQEIDEVQRQIDSFERIRVGAEQHERLIQQPAGDSPLTQEKQELTAVSDTPAQTEDPRHGARRTVKGTLSDVHCFGPSTMKLKVTGATKVLALHSGNYYKVEYSALNYKPSSDLNPCRDLEGAKAKIDYFEGVNSETEGQIISIEIAK